MVLRLVVDPHVVGDVGGRQKLPADVAGNLLLVADQVGAEAVPRGERRRAGLREGGGGGKGQGQGGGGGPGETVYRALEGPLCGVHLSDVAVQVIRSGKKTTKKKVNGGNEGGGNGGGRAWRKPWRSEGRCRASPRRPGASGRGSSCGLSS